MYGINQANLGAGGAIISNRHILSTAFIMQPLFPVQFTQIFVGGTSRVTQTNLPFNRRDPHPSYQASPRLNDIGIYRLNNDITFTTILRPIRLPDRMLPYESEQGTALGFGGHINQNNNAAGMFRSFSRF